MLSKLLQIWDELKSSYWFIPTLMSMGALASSSFLTQNQWALNTTLFEENRWLYSSSPEGAREVMSIIAGSMITVAGVTFSITIASVAYATSQFGPRLLTNFMADRGNQTTLGTFIATFLYCLMVLRTLTGSDMDAEHAGFVPQLAVAGGVMFGVASIGVLIYFVHHVPASIHASNVIGGIGQQLLAKVDELYPAVDQDGGSTEHAENAPQAPARDSQIHLDLANSQLVRANFDGFVQFVDEEKLIATATKHDTSIVLDVRPGDFVTSGSYLGWLLTSEPLAPAAEQAIQESVLHGIKRTAAQDIMFLARELVEIAARALSPGVNDPFTAMNCFDWLSSSLAVMATRPPTSGRHYDQKGQLRLIAKPVSHEYFISENLSMIRVYASTDRNAALHFQSIIARLLLLSTEPKYRELLLDQASQLLLCSDGSLCDLDQSELKSRHRILTDIGLDDRGNDLLVQQHHWLGGSA